MTEQEHNSSQEAEDPQTAEDAAPESVPSKGEVSPLQDIITAIDAQKDVDAKLAVGVVFMERALAQPGAPQFRVFWELRKLCQGLFKEHVSTGIRLKLWPRFNELLEEGRRLKAILDEQAAFAVEQIEIAIKGLEDDVAHLSHILEKAPEVGLPKLSTAEFAAHLENYELIQRELNLLNACAARVNAMRKELIKTDMRIGQKNKFFQRLSAVGDLVFPRRKELIKEVSQRFTSDVEAFIAAKCEPEPRAETLFAVREEIKNLQAMAKILTLNTTSFNRTRLRLSDCWEKIKGAEKELRKERAKKKAIFRDNAGQLITQIEGFKEEFRGGHLSIDIAKQRVDELFSGMRGLELARDEMNHLRELLRQTRQLVLEQIKEVERAHKLQAEERQRKRRADLDELRNRAERMLEEPAVLSSAQIAKERDDLVRALDAHSLLRAERLEFERLLRPLKDLIVERREQELLLLSEDDQQALKQLREVWRERCARREAIRQQLKVYRKAGGISGRDFEQALLFNAEQAEERERLEKLNRSIEEIEEKIFELEEGSQSS